MSEAKQGDDSDQKNVVANLQIESQKDEEWKYIVGSLVQTVADLMQKLTLVKAENAILKAEHGVPTMDWWINRRRYLGQRVSRLPDLVLLAIFNQMTPADQLVASAVCRRWADLVPEVTHHRRSLALIIGRSSCRNNLLVDAEHSFNRLTYGQDWSLLRSLLKPNGKPQYPPLRLTAWNSLQIVSHLSTDQFASIITHFTRLKTLSLYIEQSLVYPIEAPYDYIPYHHLARILEHWNQTDSANLTTLQLVVQQIPETLSFQFHTHLVSGRFIAALNRLSSLKRLDLDLIGHPLPELTILGQLEEVNVRADGEEFLKQLERYATDTKPSQITFSAPIKCQRPAFFNRHRRTLVPEALRGHFLRCDDYLNRLNLDFVALCAHFKSLTTLKLTLMMPRLSVYDFFRLLSQLPQLDCLNLDYYSLHHILPDNHQPNRLLWQVSSVRVLHLSDVLPNQLERLNIAWTMPSIEVLQIDFPDYFSNNLATTKDTLRRLFAPLKANLAKLRQFHYKHEDLFGSVEQLLLVDDQ